MAAEARCAHAAIPPRDTLLLRKIVRPVNRTKAYYKDQQWLPEGSALENMEVDDLLPKGAMRKSYSYDGTDPSENNPGLMYVITGGCTRTRTRTRQCTRAHTPTP